MKMRDVVTGMILGVAGTLLVLASSGFGRWLAEWPRWIVRCWR